ncbi:hypothetical protein B0H13DRAFT_1874459 [Mycena leptocephala]|nr:hypothetical protein B0H13DRAFT_1874459 [Mycena leptocephala]
MPMKLTKAQRHAAASSSPAYELLPGPSMPHPLAKVPAHIARRPDVQLFGGITLIQPCLPSLLGQFEAASDSPDMMPIDDSPLAPDPNPGQHRRKRAVQWQRWQQEVVPALLPHFARLLQETKSLRDLDASRPTKLHKVAIVRFSTIEDLELQVCKCTPAAVQLMQVSAFGCAPILPSLAVDLRVLEFTMNLFLQVAPNNTAISIALERVLSNMGFQLDHQNSLRRRFGNCLMWYTHLRNRLKAKYSGLLEAVREVLVPQAEVEPEEEPEEITPPAPPPLPRGCQAGRSGPAQRRPPAHQPLLPPRVVVLGESSPYPEIPFPEPPPRACPSEYLRRRCPACFGNLQHDPSEIVDVMVSIDACFTQKKEVTQRSPKYHLDTHFVPEDLAAKTEAYVDSVRNASNNETRRKRQAGMSRRRRRMATSTRTSCYLGLSSTDARRPSKPRMRSAESKHRVLRRYRVDGAPLSSRPVLWVVNMHSAGEKQFGVILLIERLFEHLPRRGFGLSDGEGCERFWNSIRHLIPHLRISGYHNHLYTLDAQIEHTDETSLLRLGQWVSRRYAHSVQKRAEATKAFRECGKSQMLLREQWTLQVLAQTKPLPRRAKNCGEKAVNSVILLRSAVTARQGLVRDLRQKFLDGVMEDDPEAAMYETEFKAAEEALRKLTELLRRKEAALGVDEQQELHELASSDYMRIRMNARTLKIRLRLRLRARKFELDPVERALRRLVNGSDGTDTDPDSKLHAHTVSAVKRREPTIMKLVGEYNKLCAQIAKLIKDGKAPRGSIPPVPIPAKGLWQLDVNDAIFQDVGLDDNDDGSTAPPLWLCDDQVRAGIKAVLQLDRCDEEDARLLREKCALRVWFAEEWDIVIKAIENADSEVDRYHLRLHQDKLVRLCVTWDKHLPNFGVSTVALPPWGPSAFQIAQCNVDAHLAARREDRHYGEETEDSDGEGNAGREESGGEDEDFATLDALERANIYRG